MKHKTNHSKVYFPLQTRSLLTRKIIIQKWHKYIWCTEHPCDINNGGCEQKCNKVERAAVCGCNEGYTLGDDGKSCEKGNIY